MEKDKWKKIIDEHRDEFESELPSPHVWNAIDKQLDLHAPKMIRLSTVWRLAAAAVVVISVGFYLLFQQKENQNTLSKQETNSALVLASISPEYAEMENYYVSRISTAMNELENYQPEDEMLSALKDLDKEFKQLQIEMGEGVNQSEIVEAMIEIYRIKLNLLQEMLNNLRNTEEVHTSKSLKTA